MTELTFVTSNNDKYRIATEIFQAAGLALKQAKLDLDEIQSEDVLRIATIKAAEAYALLHTPLIIRGDSWSIPGLGGFPGPYMKSINHWFTTEDFLRLTRTLPDRRAILTQTIVFHDANGQKVFQSYTEAELLPEPRGNGDVPFENIASINGDKGRSITEVMQSGTSNINRAPAKLWHEFIAWYKEGV